MAEIVLDGVTVTFGGPPLLDGVSFSLQRGERVGLLGRNGSGKSTLLRVIAGELVPDDGRVIRRAGCRVGALVQDVPTAIGGTVRDVVAGGAAADASPHESQKAVQRQLDRLALDPAAPFSTLSAGTKRRVLLARAIASAPDVLLLDEPTNHLDIDAIDALEDALLGFRGALLFVTHDRAFLRRLATRIVDIDRGRLASHAADYDSWLERKAAEAEAEDRANALADKKLAQEEAWIRRGVEARRTRNMGRVRALERLRAERKARRDRIGTTTARLADAERSGELVLRAKGLGHAFGDVVIARDLDLDVWRGDRIGIVGPNGAGKSTLLSLLLGERRPQTGEVRIGTNVVVGRADQLQATLDPERTLWENVAGPADTVTVGGRTRHVVSWLADFLFTPDQVRAPVSRLSGGERNRAQLAKLLARSANLLVLDEPTNDLDLETLEFLEALLADFAGTVLVVGHDREFLDRVVTSVLAWEGPGRWVEHVGSFSDWWAKRRKADESARPGAATDTRAANPRPAARKGLSFSQAHELERLPARIEALEAEQAALGAALGAADFHRKPPKEQQEARRAFDAKSAEVEAAMARWEELELLAAETARGGDRREVEG